MKVYGFDDTGPHRGDLLTANVTASDLDFGLDMLAGELGWEHAFTSFTKARKALIDAMLEEGTDDELIQALRSLKAGDLQ